LLADTPYQQSLYEERWRSYSEFARTSNHLWGAWGDAEDSISKNVDTPQGLDKLSQADLLAAGQAAAAALQARRKYSEDVTGLIGPWPEWVVERIRVADAASEQGLDCYY